MRYGKAGGLNKRAHTRFVGQQRGDECPLILGNKDLVAIEKKDRTRTRTRIKRQVLTEAEPLKYTSAYADFIEKRLYG